MQARAILLFHIGLIPGLTATYAQPSRAQADLNIQSRIEALTPPPPVVHSEPTVRTITRETIEPRTQTIRKEVPRSDAEVEADLQKKQGPSIATFRAMSAAEQRASAKALGIPLTKIQIQTRTVNVRVKKSVTVVEPRKTTFTVSVSPGLSYESNVFKTHLNVHGDAVFSGGAGFALNVPVGKDDTFTLSAASVSARYPNFPELNFDAITAIANYRYVIGGFYPLQAAQSQDTKVLDALDLRVTTSSSFEPLFSRETVTFVTPSMTVSRLNIPLSNQLCGEKRDAFCYYADISGSLGYSFSDVLIQENANGNAAATLGWRMPESRLTLALTGKIGGRHYTNFPGSRDDLTLSGGPSILWSLYPNVTASFGVTYYEQYSTVDRARWNGVIAMSGLTAKFSPLP